MELLLRSLALLSHLYLLEVSAEQDLINILFYAKQRNLHSFVFLLRGLGHLGVLGPRTVLVLGHRLGELVDRQAGDSGIVLVPSPVIPPLVPPIQSDMPQLLYQR